VGLAIDSDRFLQQPQSVKTAELFLRMESIETMMVKLRQIVQSKQGDDESSTGIIMVATFYAVHCDRGWWCLLFTAAAAQCVIQS
jgi:hypothetical protein